MPAERDWVHVVEQETCPECGLDAGAAARGELTDQIERAARSWATVLTATPVPSLRARPGDAAWSPLEYGGHVRGVLRVFGERISRTLVDDDPDLGWWDHEAAVHADGYQQADPVELAGEITAAAASLCAPLAELDDAQWARTARRRVGERFSIEGMVRFAWHEMVHHRHDAAVQLTANEMSAPMSAELADQQLRRPPVVPADVAAFSSNTLFGQPGIYPDGPPMSPAPGPALDESSAATVLSELLDAHDAAAAQALLDDPAIRERVPDVSVRTALALLTGGPAAPLLDAFVVGSTPVLRLGIGAPVGEGRVLGPEQGDDDTTRRVLNERYRHEHPAAIAPSLAHALCHHGERASNAEEATLHGLLAAVHAWLLAGSPQLGGLRSELARRQASLTITLLNARPPGRPSASIVCPDGSGTIPGGNPALQCSDLWSIPFTSRSPVDCDLEVPSPVRESLGRLAAGTAPEVPARYDEQLGAWLRDHLGQGAWFGPIVRARAGVALGLFGPPPDAVQSS
jgi:hypothetical protein